MRGGKALRGQVALITGAGRGIGYGIAIELASAGADVFITDIMQPGNLQEFFKPIRDRGGRAGYAQADIAHRSDVERVVDQCERELGPVSILVSNAVVSVRRSLLDTQFDDLKRAVEVGIYGAFHMFQVVARKMVAQGIKGSIIQLSSPYASLPFRQGLDYVVAKSGVHHMTMAVANELMWHGIRVNLVMPGWTDTPGEHRWFDDDTLRMEADQSPLGRLCTAEDVGRAVVYLATEPYLVGTVIKVDGGNSMQRYGPPGDSPWLEAAARRRAASEFKVEE